MGMWWRAARSAGAAGGRKAPAQAGQADPRRLLEKFQQACAANDPRAARERLLQWAAARWPGASPRGLDELARRLPRQASAYLVEIDRGLYAPESSPWDGMAAWRALAPLLQAQATVETGEGSTALPPLYPRDR